MKTLLFTVIMLFMSAAIANAGCSITVVHTPSKTIIVQTCCDSNGNNCNVTIL